MKTQPQYYSNRAPTDCSNRAIVTWPLLLHLVLYLHAKNQMTHNVSIFASAIIFANINFLQVYLKYALSKT